MKSKANPQPLSNSEQISLALDELRVDYELALIDELLEGVA